MCVDHIRFYDPNVFADGAKNALWNNASNWTQGVPTEGDDVLINGNCDLNVNSAALNSLIVNEGKTLTIQSGNTLTVQTLSTSAVSQLVIESSAQLKHYNAGAFATFEKQIEPYTVSHGTTNNPTDGWYLIASPLASPVELGNVTNLIPANPNNYDLYWFNRDNVGSEWLNLKAHANESDYQRLWCTFGYLYANNSNSPDDITLQFAGVINPVGSDVLTLSNNESNEQFGTWNLVGNPNVCEVYPIYGGEVEIVGGGDLDKSGNFQWVDYGAMPYYRMNSARTDLVAGNGTIQPGEGVFMQYDANMGESVMVRFSTEAYNDGNNIGGDITLNLTEAMTRGGASNVLIDRAIVRFDGGPMLGKLMLDPSHTNICIPQGGKDYAIVRSTAEGELPLNFKASQNGSYTLSVTVNDAEMEYLHLIDNLTGADIDLLETPSYTFEARMSDYSSRFRLVFRANDANGASTSSATFAFFDGNSWQVNNTGAATLQVIDVLGRIVSSQTINGNATLGTDNLGAGVYVMRLVNGDEVKVQKVVVR